MNATVKSIVTIIKAIAIVGMVAGITLAVIDTKIQTVDMDQDQHSTLAEPKVDTKVMAKAEAGRTCTAKPVLTDIIVVVDAKTGETRIMGFDATYAAAKEGTVKVVTYCK